MSSAVREWAPAGTPEMNLLIAEAAHGRVGELEIPPGSNRSPWIDRSLEYCGLSPHRDGRGWPWCAAGLTDWFLAGGAEVPPMSAEYWRGIKQPPLGPASCDGWLQWALATGRFSSVPVVGAAVLYGTLKDATHCGCIVRVDPVLTSVEGNTTFHSYSREGVVCDIRPVTAERVIGYVHPLPTAA